MLGCFKRLPRQGPQSPPGPELRHNGIEYFFRCHLFKVYVRLDSNSLGHWLLQFFEDAESRAQQCDERASAERGPLHGLPISVKECYQYKGLDSTVGKFPCL